MHENVKAWWDEKRKVGRSVRGRIEEKKVVDKWRNLSPNMNSDETLLTFQYDVCTSTVLGQNIRPRFGRERKRFRMYQRGSFSRATEQQFPGNLMVDGLLCHPMKEKRGEKRDAGGRAVERMECQTTATKTTMMVVSIRKRWGSLKINNK